MEDVDYVYVKVKMNEITEKHVSFTFDYDYI